MITRVPAGVCEPPIKIPMRESQVLDQEDLFGVGAGASTGDDRRHLPSAGPADFVRAIFLELLFELVLEGDLYMPKKKLAKAGSKESHQNVLLEEISSKFDVLGEKIQSFETRFDEIDEKIDTLKRELKQDIKTTQQALGMRIDNVESKLGARIDRLEKKVEDNTTAIVELSGRIDQNTAEITVLSGKVDKINNRLDHHEEEIAHLKEAAV